MKALSLIVTVWNVISPGSTILIRAVRTAGDKQNALYEDWQEHEIVVFCPRLRDNRKNNTSLKISKFHLLTLLI